MSGLSTTFTFVCDGERRARVLAGLAGFDLSAIDEIPEDECVHASSRNDAMEWRLNHLIREWRLPDLPQLQNGFDPVTGGTLEGGWWSTWLGPDELPRAVAALDALLEHARADPEKMLAILGDEVEVFDPEELRTLAMAAPTPVADAKAAYWRAREYSDGDDVRSLIGFVHAHRAVLELARLRGGGAMYVAYLY